MDPINDNARREFEYRYEASMVLSDRPFRRVRRPTYAETQRFMTNPHSISYPYSERVEEVDMVEICLPRDKLPDLLESQDSYLFAREREEKRLREEYPALKSAWEQYQIVLMMVK